MSNYDIESLFSEFEAAKSVSTKLGIDEDTAKAYRFYEGDQWYGLESGGEQMPVYNFIAPVIRYKTAMVAMNNISICYSAPTKSQRANALCSQLSKMALARWEALKMDTKCWEAVKASMISGDSYLYFSDGDGEAQVIDRTDILFADESQPDISKQSYIFIKERVSVDAVKRLALENGISEEETAKIASDEEDGDYGQNKCTCILKMWIDGGALHFLRFTNGCIFEPEQVIDGLDIYPVAVLRCNPSRKNARGIGEVMPLVANQIEINRNLARRILNAKLTAYSRLVYANDRIINPKALTEVGTAIEVDGGGVGSISDAVSYLTPSSMSPDAKILSDELLSITKELSGAGDAALGAIDPTQASGSAIIAVRDQAALPLNEQTAKFRQFCEDIARIWYKLWAVYNPDGIELPNGQTATPTEVMLLCPDVRVDISNTSPFSKYARESALERLFSMGQISFEEYVASLDDDSTVPKATLEKIITQRLTDKKENDNEDTGN